MNCHTAGYNASAPDVVSKFVSEGKVSKEFSCLQDDN